MFTIYLRKSVIGYWKLVIGNFYLSQKYNENKINFTCRKSFSKDFLQVKFKMAYPTAENMHIKQIGQLKFQKCVSCLNIIYRYFASRTLIITT